MGDVMGSKQEKINKIIDDLEMERGYDSNTSSMTRDGIVGSESEYSGITVVLKEAPDMDFASEIANPNGLEPKNFFSYNLNKIKYAINQALNGGPYDEDTAENIKNEKITGIGYVNLKKKAEEHYNTPDSDVRVAAEKDGKYIKAELNTLDPKVIYCAGKNIVYDSVKKMYPELDGKEIYNHDGVHIFDVNGRRIIIIDGNHPSDWSRFDAKAIYDRLSKPEVELAKLKKQQDNVLKEMSDYTKKQPDQTSKKKEKFVNFNAHKTETVIKSIHTKDKAVTTSANSGDGGFSSPPPQIMAIIGIIVLVIVLLLLLRTCSGCSLGSGRGDPSSGILTDQSSEPPQPPPMPLNPPSVLPSITYCDIHFIKDTRFFLSEGNRYTNMQPVLTEGEYEDRLNKIAQDIKDILTVLPDQTFIITDYAADIPGHEEGEMKLSIQRAERVKEFLVRFGVPSKSLQCVYMGGTNRWGDNSSEETKRGNRVVTIAIKQ
jgi:outer membrane protein OmpA-like peptidoglycan-associated protein